MVLQNVGHNDEGTYICTAENGVGLPDTAAAVLTVLRKFLIISVSYTHLTLPTKLEV